MLLKLVVEKVTIHDCKDRAAKFLIPFKQRPVCCFTGTILIYQKVLYINLAPRKINDCLASSFGVQRLMFTGEPEDANIRVPYVRHLPIEL